MEARRRWDLTKLTVPQPVPAALRSLFELKDKSTAPSVNLYFGPAAPTGNESQWIKTNPGKGWFAYFRIYGPEQRAFDGSWKPGDFEEMR